MAIKDDQLPTGFSRTGFDHGRRADDTSISPRGAFSGMFYDSARNLYLEGGPLYHFTIKTAVLIPPILLRDAAGNWEGAEGDSLWLRSDETLTWAATAPDADECCSLGTLTDGQFVGVPPSGYYSFRIDYAGYADKRVLLPTNLCPA